MPYRVPSALVLLALVALSGRASAAERNVYIGSFDTVRIQGAFEVRVETGRSPGATISGDSRVLDSVEIRVDGTTLLVRPASGAWGERPRASAREPVTITLATPNLVSASMFGAGRLGIGTMKGARIDLAVTGNGGITVAAIDADAANATIIGGGAITMAGRTGKARLMTNGPGTIDASGLDAGDLVVRLDGPGTTQARARYTAQVANTGLGAVTIEGSPKCTVKSDAGGPVTCGPTS